MSAVHIQSTGMNWGICPLVMAALSTDRIKLGIVGYEGMAVQAVCRHILWLAYPFKSILCYDGNQGDLKVGVLHISVEVR